jgi:hypothetical protein
MKSMAPIGTKNMKTMALALGGGDPAWFSYIFNQCRSLVVCSRVPRCCPHHINLLVGSPANHLPGVPLPESASFHGYASCSNRSDPTTYTSFFTYVDNYFPTVSAIMAVRNAMNPSARIDLDESGACVPARKLTCVFPCQRLVPFCARRDPPR